MTAPTNDGTQLVQLRTDDGANAREAFVRLERDGVDAGDIDLITPSDPVERAGVGATDEAAIGGARNRFAGIGLVAALLIAGIAVAVALLAGAPAGLVIAAGIGGLFVGFTIGGFFGLQSRTSAAGGTYETFGEATSWTVMTRVPTERAAEVCERLGDLGAVSSSEADGR